MNSTSGNWWARAAFFKTIAGQRFGIGHREKIYEINRYFPSVCDKLTFTLSKFKSETSSIVEPILFSENSSSKKSS